MQALEKVAINTSWISIVLVLLLTTIAVLKIIDAEKLKGYAFSLFNKGIIADEVEEGGSLFTSFYGLLFVFSSTVIALAINFVLAERSVHFTPNFSSFLSVLGAVFCYYSIKIFIEVLFSRLFLLKNRIRFFDISKFGFRFSISIFLFFFFIIFQFGPLNASYFIYIILGLFLLKFLFHVMHNKNLIFSELFYFILYICAFEIAPLLIVLKLML